MKCSHCGEPFRSFSPEALATYLRVEESSSTWCEVSVSGAGCRRIPWVYA